MSKTENTLNYSLSVRIERPVVGCELVPYTYLAIKGGAIDNVTRAKIMDANPHYLIWRWTAGARKPVCANGNCPRANTMDPIHWSRVARGGPGLRCTICEKLKISRDESSFCSMRYVELNMNSMILIFKI